MSAHFRGNRTEHDRAQGVLPSASIEHGQISIDDVVLSANWIEQHGVSIQALEAYEVHRLTISFLVSDITVDDEALPRVRVLPTESAH